MRRLLLLTFVLALGAAGSASAQETAPVESTANGNIFTGGLGFSPADMDIAVGTVIAWRNTDFLVPHTVTERHGLWDLTGGWGATPLTPPGFGPGTVAMRKFEAGTHDYYCVVHPEPMTGKVAVPVTVSSSRSRVRLKRRRGRKPGSRVAATVAMRWGNDTPVDGQAFDVQRRLPGGDWRVLADGTKSTSSTFRTHPRRVWEIRARLRSTENAENATDWSPPATVTG